MPLVINSLKGGTYTHTQASHTKVTSRKTRHAPGLKIHIFISGIHDKFKIQSTKILPLNK